MKTEEPEDWVSSARRRCIDCEGAPWLPADSWGCPDCGREFERLSLVVEVTKRAAEERLELLRELPYFEEVDELLEADFPGDPCNKKPEFRCSICPEEPWISAGETACLVCGTDFFELPVHISSESRPEQRLRLGD